MSDTITIQTYDRIAADFAERYWDVVLERALDSFAAGLPSGSRVMDLGCGPGRDIALLRTRVLNMLGVDRSTGMLHEAGRRVGGMLACADMRYLPLYRASLDGIWMCASLLHMPRSDAPVVLAEASRVLRAGGILYVSVQEGTGESWSDSDGGKRFFTFYQVDDIKTLVEQAGFVVADNWTNVGGHSNWISLLAVRGEH
ncbi:MAG: class I SAM-dependent methyltransferase [Chloroflexota bacterium]